MPDLNVLTWNSTGESVAKANFLHQLITNNPAVPGWKPDILVIQEAQAAQGGPIWAMLANLGTPGNPQYDPYYAAVAPAFAGIPGEGYILMRSAVTALAAPFAPYDLATDPGVVAALAPYPHAQRQQLQQAAADYRAPAACAVTFGGRTIPLMTWHAELGPGLPFMLGVNAAVNYTAYFLLQSSDLYLQTLCQPGGGNTNLSLIAGDLNATPLDLGSPTGCPAVPHLLPNWTAASNHLDHIAARRDNGPGGIAFPEQGHYASPSTHDVLVATVHWP